MPVVTENEARIAVRTRFNTRWSALHPTMPRVFANEVYNGSDPEWCRLTLQNIAASVASLNAGVAPERRWRMAYVKAVRLEFFVAPNRGEGRAWALYEQAKDIFDRVRFDGLSFDAARAIGGSVVEDGAYFHLGLYAPFRFRLERRYTEPV